MAGILQRDRKLAILRTDRLLSRLAKHNSNPFCFVSVGHVEYLDFVSAFLEEIYE